MGKEYSIYIYIYIYMYIYSEIVFSLYKEGNLDICNNTGEPGGHHGN